MLSSLLTTLALLRLSLSAPLTPRAGGPSLVPIPSTCSVTCSAPTYPVDAFTPSPSFSASHHVYSNYIPAGSYGGNVSTIYNTCLEQCFGFGNPGECVSTVFAANVTYQAYGVESVGYACEFFDAEVKGEDLVAIGDGSWTGARGTNIGCAREA